MPNRANKPQRQPVPVLVWVAVASALAIAVHRIAVTWGAGRELAAVDHSLFGGKSGEWVTNITVLWALVLLFFAFRLWQAAERNRSTIQAIIESVRPDVLLLVDRGRRITMSNPSISEMFGYEPEEVLHKTTDLLYLDRRENKQGHEIRDFVEQYGFHVGPAVGIRRDGANFPLEITTGNLRGDWGVVLLLRDVTERKMAEDAMLRARDAAEAANATKTQFLSNMSHELRTPLNSIIGFADVLLEQYFGELNEKQKEYGKHISESGKHLLDLINDILDLSKVEAGKMELLTAVADVPELVQSCTVLIKERLVKHGIQLELRGLDALPHPEVALDPRKFKQILFNLLSNAAKFTPDGGCIRVEAAELDGSLHVSVSDTGIGISKEDQERVFDEFYQVQSGLTNKTPGTGLGLPLTMKLVALHGGTISVMSEGEGKGTCFSFNIPVHLPDEADGLPAADLDAQKSAEAGVRHV